MLAGGRLILRSTGGLREDADEKLNGLAFGEDLPRGTTVVLWGADDPTWAQLDRERTPACRWVRCSREATTDDVGSLCSMLLG